MRRFGARVFHRRLQGGVLRASMLILSFAILIVPAAFCSKTLYASARRKEQTKSRSDLSMSTNRAASADAATDATTTIATGASAAMGHAGDPHLQQ